MKTPQDLGTPRAPRRRGRSRWWIAAAIVVLIVVIASFKSLATLYTDALWFSSIGQRGVWSTLVLVKLGLFASFGAAFFVILWINLMVCDRLGAASVTLDPEDELVRRYQQVVRPYSGRIYAVLAFVLALIAASDTIGQWQNWILFRHGVSFGTSDPQFHMDIGFFVFKLPFYNFVVSWTIVSLIVIFVVTTIFHYLNGGIRVQRASLNVRASVKVHLSVILAVIALFKAAGYFLQRFQLDVSQNGYVEGAGYTDVHARMPALELLILISLAAAAILLYNIRRQGWTLPLLAVGVWAFVALVVGVIYPAILQALKVNPAQSTLERPYIQRNIEATRAAYNLNNIAVHKFSGGTSLTSSQVIANSSTLANIRLWDPDPNISLPTFQKLQSVRSYYTFQSLAVDRYDVDGKETPAVVGVRQVATEGLASSSWVTTHLVYTHGEGLALAPANQASSNGNPQFAIQDVPPSSSHGLPRITQPGVYFGLDDPGYVIANTRQAELDYQTPNGNNVSSHYSGTGGVQLNNFLTRFAFFVRLGDFNLLISDLIKPQSRILFVRDVQAMAQKAAPFLSYDADPYAAVVNGHLDWILDAYTTTNQYPYSENASSEAVPTGSGLPSSYNYVRNSVKVVIDAYSGKMTFYAMDNDPILRTYEAAFPHLFTPQSQMPAALRSHLRYPEDIFSIQAAMFGRYHITNAAQFFVNGDAWNLSPTAGVGSPSNALAVTITTNAAGQIISTPPQRMAPIYQVEAEPGSTKQTFLISDAYVPVSQGTGSQILSGFITGNSDPGHYGQLAVYETPAGQSVVGPAIADSEIQQSSKVSTEITFLDQHGSSVILGNILMIPIDNTILYVRPLYVESTGNPQPQLRYVIAVFGQHVDLETTLDAALSSVLGTTVGGAAGSSTPSSSGSSTGVVGSATAQQAQADLKAASAQYTQAQTDLKNGNLGAYQSDIAAMNQDIQAAESLLGTVAPTPTGASTTTTTAPKKTVSTKKKKATATASAANHANLGTVSSSTSNREPSSTTTTGEALGR